jgi:hypothetical protein
MVPGHDLFHGLKAVVRMSVVPNGTIGLKYTKSQNIYNFDGFLTRRDLQLHPLPLVERVVFIDQDDLLRLTIQSTKEIYQPREEVRLEVVIAGQKFNFPKKEGLGTNVATPLF